MINYCSEMIIFSQIRVFLSMCQKRKSLYTAKKTKSLQKMLCN